MVKPRRIDAMKQTQTHVFAMCASGRMHGIGVSVKALTADRGDVV